MNVWFSQCSPAIAIPETMIDSKLLSRIHDCAASSRESVQSIQAHLTAECNALATAANNRVKTEKKTYI